MGRELWQISVVPLMSAAIPVPEPPPVTMMTLPAFAFMNFSAQRWPRMTMVSEPFTVIGLAAELADAASSTSMRSDDAIDVRFTRPPPGLELVLELDRPQVVVGIGEPA